MSRNSKFHRQDRKRSDSRHDVARRQRLLRTDPIANSPATSDDGTHMMRLSPEASANNANSHPYTMSLGLNVLNHLGIGLYSNVPAVLSEIVANAWDADASLVTIDINRRDKTITVYDDGIGMLRSDINSKYLMVGYNKRESEPEKTPRGRTPMGRKGIGKLSVFAIADIVEVYSIRDGQKNAMRMSLQAIKDQIKAQDSGSYHPEPLDTSTIDFEKGTKIVLKALKKDLSATATYLRKRLARRFSIISARHGFQVRVDGEDISPSDRDFFDKLEFAWFIGREDPQVRAACANVRSVEILPGEVNKDKGYEITGWIGTVGEQKDIDEENNTIVIYAHGKLIQEDILKDLKEAGFYAEYLIGEISAEFMDLNDLEDIVTSNRQSVKEDDERYQELKAHVRSLLKRVQSRWSELRRKASVERALRHPIVDEWYSRLSADTRRYAEQLFAKIESMKIADEEARREMYKSGILAFERLRLRDSLSKLQSIETAEQMDLLAQLFGQIDEIEAVHYYEIAKARLGILEKFEQLVDEDAKERILQRHIFEHLWLLHPSWERATSNPRIEQAVTKEFGEIDASLTDDEKAGRIDIRYRTAAGEHIIVELKKYGRTVETDKLFVQVRKYRDALKKCLDTKFPGEVNLIECIIIIGSPPEPHDPEHARENIDVLARIGARYVLYDELIANAQSSYAEYLALQRRESDLFDIMERFDQNFSLAETEPKPTATKS